MIPQLRFEGTIARAPYLATSISVVLIQLLLHHFVYEWHPMTSDSALNGMEFLPAFTLWSYTSFSLQWQFALWPLVAVGVIDIFTAWLLLTLAIRRARTTDRSLLLACLAMVPFIQIPTIGWLGWSSAQKDGKTSDAPARVPLDVALKGLSAGLVVTVVLEVVGTLVLRTYGYGLFLASPFIVGFITAYIGNRRSDIGSGATTRLVLGACFLGSVGLLAVAVEGVICLAMAAPLIGLMAWIGGIVGRLIARKRPSGAPGRTVMSVSVLPLLVAADLVAPPNISFESIESVEVSAAADDVWDAVVHMGPIPTPPSAPFSWGLAYPMSGQIFGSGVGAIREGVFFYRSCLRASHRMGSWQAPLVHRAQRSTYAAGAQSLSQGKCASCEWLLPLAGRTFHHHAIRKWSHTIVIGNAPRT